MSDITAFDTTPRLNIWLNEVLFGKLVDNGEATSYMAIDSTANTTGPIITTVKTKLYFKANAEYLFLSPIETFLFHSIDGCYR